MSDLIQTGFDYGDLPAEKVLECETAFQTACAIENQAVVMIGEQFAKVKANLKFLRNGNGFREWCESRAKISHVTAFNYINAFENRESVKNFNTFGKSALFLLTAPNTPQEVRDRADALAEAGEDVSVKTIKKLKADVEAERQARFAAEQKSEEEQRRSSEWRDQWKQQRDETEKTLGQLSSALQEKGTLQLQLNALKNQPAPPPVTVEKIVAPADYETAKATAAKLKEDLAALRKKQDDLVQQQVKAKLREREKELADLDRKAKDAEARLQSLNKQIDSYSSIERMTRLQRDQIEKCRSMLVELAANMEGFDRLENDPKTDQLWAALADMLRNGAAAIDFFCGDKKTGLKPELTVIQGGAA